MAVTWRFEAWTHPRLGTPTRVVGSLPFTRAQLADREDAVVDSWIEIPAARRSDIEALLNIDPETISNSRSRIIRAYRVDTEDSVPVDGGGNKLPDHEFIAADLTWRIAEGGVQLAKIAGPDFRGSVDEAAVLAYDYPQQPTTARDWQWNGPNLFDNGDLENLSAEIQWFYIDGIGSGSTYTVTFDGQTTTPLTWGADPNVRLANLEAALEALSNLGDVEIIGEGTLLDPFEILYVVPAGEDLPTISVTPSAGTATVGVISTGGFPSIEGWTKAYNPVTGQEYGQYTEFRSTSPDYGETGLGGSSGAVTMTIPAGAGSRYSGGQVILSVTPGTMLQLSIDAKCTSTIDTFRFVVRDLVGQTESRLKSTPEMTFAAAGVEQTFTLDDVKVRPQVERILVRFSLTTVGGPVDPVQLVLDNLVVQEGFRGTSKGGIVETVHTDLSVSHAPRTRLDWLSLGFGVVNDSSGTPWIEDDLPYVVRHGMRFGSHLLGGLQELGSLWDVVPLTPTTWRLDLWDEANKGTDHSADPTIAFLVGQLADGTMQHRLPAETNMIAVGEGGVWAEVEDADLVAAFGPIDGYVENDDWLDAITVTSAATEHLAREAQNALSVKAVTSSSKGPVPWKQVAVGDRATFTLGTVAKHTRRIRQCTVTITPDSWSAEWVASRVFIGESATQEALRRLLTAWDHRRGSGNARRTGATGLPASIASASAPGAYTHLARTATQSIAVGGAAVSWDGQGDRLGFQPTSGTAVTIPLPAYYDIEFGFEWDTFQVGGRVWLTRNGATIWPPAGMPSGVFESDDAQVFEPEVAKGIACVPGDTIELWIDAQDVAAQTLGSAFMNIELVDRGGVETSCPVLAPPDTLVSSAFHNGFPGYAVADDGTRIIAYRQGAGHTSFDGIIRVIRSTDGGDTWSAPTTVFTNASYDAREGILTKLADGRIVMAVGVQSSVDGSGVADGGFTLISSDSGATWSTPAQIDDGGFTGWGLITGNVLELENGDWITAIVGKDAATSRRIRVIKTANDGTTWTVAAAEAADADDYGDPNFAEANLIRSGATIVMLFRDNDGSGYGFKQWRLVSQVDGTTWTTPTLVLTGYGGSPRMLLRSNGDVLVLLRDDPNGDRPPRLLRSADLCLTWSECELFAGVKFAYGQLAEDADNKVAVAYSLETGVPDATNDASIYYRRQP